MDKDRYLSMMDELGQEPKIEEIPPSLEDFPEIVIDAINTFNSLGDKVFPEIGYIGKDYTNLPYYIEIYKVENTDVFLEILLRLDAEAIRLAQDKLKREYDRMKRKAK
tara:strand:- start:7633 stop:7956 length:324 start_codon:yes stop_codon:yes gene_type:complete